MHNPVTTFFIHLNQRGFSRIFACHGYRIEGKVVWGYKDGELTQFDPYTDDNYHLV
jgi:hypothetical protein